LRSTFLKTLMAGTILGVLAMTQVSLSAQGFDLVLNDAPVTVYFSPNGGAQDAIVQAIDSAKQSIMVQEYELTSPVIARALVDASQRGVKVLVMVDKGQQTERYSCINLLARAGLDVFIDAQHKIAHTKMIVVDRETTLGGSYNLSRSAETGNSEDMIVIKSATLARIFQKNFEEHLSHSGRYVAR